MAAKKTSKKAVEPVVGEKKTSSLSVTVSWRGNTRVYSNETHGTGFRELAEEFATKVGGTVE